MNLKKNILKKNIDLNFTRFSKKHIFKHFNYAAEICEAPPLSLFTLGMISSFKKIKDQKIKVVLNGQGVDEIFGGYNLFYKKIRRYLLSSRWLYFISNNRSIFRYKSKIKSISDNNLLLKENIWLLNLKYLKI